LFIAHLYVRSPQLDQLGRVAATRVPEEVLLDPSRLKSIPLFADIPDEELAKIATFAQEVTVEAGRELVREGDFSYEFMAIEDGEAEVTRDGEHVADLGPGDFFGEMGLLEKTLRNATVTATTPVRIVTLTGWDLKRIERNVPEAIERVRTTLEERRPPEE
jgi:CRP-like cAMP-binding protein